jgi:GTP:adenosylcobinamide-phosphate guanylyltransferase
LIGQVNALILAGSRGPQDPIATLAGVTHKALAPIAGQTMLARVIEAVRAGSTLDRLFICIDEDSLASAEPELRQVCGAGGWSVIPPGPSPAASVAAALDRIGVARPLLITTADHPLLTGAMVSYFLNHAPADADLAVALSDEVTIRRVYPDNRRTYYRLGGIGFSGCNLFLARNTKAKDVAEYWRRMEGKRKNPLAIAGAVGIFTVIRFALGWLSLAGAFAHVSRLTGATIRPVLLPFAEAAIDVDKAADYELVSAILTQRNARP